MDATTIMDLSSCYSALLTWLSTKNRNEMKVLSVQVILGDFEQHSATATEHRKLCNFDLASSMSS